MNAISLTTSAESQLCAQLATFNAFESESESDDTRFIVSSDSDEDLEDIEEVEDPRKVWLDNIDKIQPSWSKEIIEAFPFFRGYCWRLCNLWYSIIPDFNGPIRYLEIGVLSGANLITVMKTYGRHPDSRADCIDPWEDYDGYDEYLTPTNHPYNVQQNNFDTFKYNLEKAGESNRVKIHRDFSSDVLFYLEDDCYDIVYIDGAHTEFNVLEDAVLSFRKVKIGGWMVFDDYWWKDDKGCGPQKGIDSFLLCYQSKLCNVSMQNGQAYAQRKN